MEFLELLLAAKSGDKESRDLLIEENNAEKQVVDAPCMLLIPRV